jgi:hypothetical protein
VVHQGERGRENEAALGRVLEGFVPRRYGVGSGLIIDTAGRYSRQTDLVVYEQSNEPTILAQTTQLLFPVESVLAAIEVKTTLNLDEILDCGKKHASIKELGPARPYEDRSEHPLFLVLAYTAAIHPETVLKHIWSMDEPHRPDLMTVLGPGLILGTPAALQMSSREGLVAGLALLRDREGNYIEGQPSGPDMIALHEGRRYPIIRFGDRLLLADPARALLLFVESIARLLATKQNRLPPVISSYVGSEIRDLALFSD